MKLSCLVPVLLMAAALTGCAANSYCLGAQDYQKATSVPPLKPTADGLKLPESSSALRIPPPPAAPVPYGQIVKNESGGEETSCLDKPPQMVAGVPTPPPPAPVAAPTKVDTPPKQP